MKDVILLKDFIDSLKDFPEDTPVVFVSSDPKYSFSMNCTFYEDLELPSGEKGKALVFMYDFTKMNDEEGK